MSATITIPAPIVRRGAAAYVRNWHRKGNPWERGTVEDAAYRDALPEGVWSYTVRLDRPSKRGGPIRIVTSHDSANIRAAEAVPAVRATRAEAGRIGGQRSAAKRARVAVAADSCVTCGRAFLPNEARREANDGGHEHVASRSCNGAGK